MRKLVPHAAQACELADEDRIRHIRASRWIGYPAAKRILSKLEGMLEHPHVHRMPNLIIVGASNNGKTALLNRFKQIHPPTNNPVDAASHVPVLLIQAPPAPDERRFYADMLFELRVPFSHQFSPGRMQILLRQVLPKLGTKMIIIDEIHNVIAGPLNSQQRFMNALKHLGNELMIPLVVAGINTALTATETDDQIESRFEPDFLPRWQFNKDFLALLASFESYLPLKEPSRLADPDIARDLYELSGGTIGDLSTLINRAAIGAINSGEEKITRSVLAKLDWVQPVRRKERIASLL